MSNDYFQFRQFTVRQNLCAMKVGTDGTLLGAWAAVPQEAHAQLSLTGATLKILDIGTGTGLIAMMMAQRFPQARVTGIDIDPQAVRQARENVAASPFAERVLITEGDVRRMVSESANGFDAIVCNPPFFEASLESPDAQRTLARHAATLTYRQLMDCAWLLLNDGGELSVVIPFDCKSRLETEATLAGFCLTRCCAVRTTARKPPRRFLMAFQKHAKAPQTEELVVGSDAYNELTQDFYLPKVK